MFTMVYYGPISQMNMWGDTEQSITMSMYGPIKMMVIITYTVCMESKGKWCLYSESEMQ